MITRIKIEGFKSLESVDLQLGRVNLFVGTNASGKSNFLEALRVLQGLAYGFTVSEVLDGKPKSATSEVWEGIRGGSRFARFLGQNGTPAGEMVIRFSVTIQPRETGEETLEYTIGVSPERGSVREERLSVNGDPIFDSASVDNPPDSPSFGVRVKPLGQTPFTGGDKSRSVLHQFQAFAGYIRVNSEDLGASTESCSRALTNMQRIEPSLALLRNYSQVPFVARMGERGENFAGLVEEILNDPKLRSAYVSWLRQLTPTEVEYVDNLHGALGEPLFALKERGRTFPAQILSDGTLRFAAITAAFFQPDMPDLLTIEEIENGIHPSRLRLLVQLLKQQSEVSGTQVIATTHSPALLAWLQPEDFRTTFLCQRDEETGASRIRSLSEVPHFLELIEQQSVAEMFAEGWLEAVP